MKIISIFKHKRTKISLDFSPQQIIRYFLKEIKWLKNKRVEGVFN